MHCASLSGARCFPSEGRVGAVLGRLRRMRLILDDPFWDNLPAGLGAHEDMPANLNVRIVIQATQGNAVDLALVYPAKRRATLLAEL